MKCAKCGYISFDHHSECKKCQTSMASVREGLGFSASKPAVPSLLGSLLRDDQAEAQQKNHAADTEAHTPSSLQEEISGVLGEGFGTEPAGAAPAVADSDETQEDFSLLDLSDEELELLIDQDKSGDDEKEEIELTGLVEGDGDLSALEPPSSPNAASPSLEIAMPEEAEASPDEELVLSFDDFYETETPGQLELAADSGEAPAGTESEAGPTLELENAVEHPEVPPGDAEKEFVLDLSEGDLDALLNRLEGATKEKA